MRIDALDQFVDGGGLVAFRLELGFDPERDAALALVGAQRAMRRPGLFGAQVRIAALQQILQRIDGRLNANDARRLKQGRGERVALSRTVKAERVGEFRIDARGGTGVEGGRGLGKTAGLLENRWNCREIRRRAGSAPD